MQLLRDLDSRRKIPDVNADRAGTNLLQVLIDALRTARVEDARSFIERQLVGLTQEQAQRLESARKLRALCIDSVQRRARAIPLPRLAREIQAEFGASSVSISIHSSLAQCINTMCVVGKRSNLVGLRQPFRQEEEARDVIGYVCQNHYALALGPGDHPLLDQYLASTSEQSAESKIFVGLVVGTRGGIPVANAIRWTYVGDQCGRAGAADAAAWMAVADAPDVVVENVGTLALARAEGPFTKTDVEALLQRCADYIAENVYRGTLDYVLRAQLSRLEQRTQTTARLLLDAKTTHYHPYDVRLSHVAGLASDVSRSAEASAFALKRPLHRPCSSLYPVRWGHDTIGVLELRALKRKQRQSTMVMELVEEFSKAIIEVYGRERAAKARARQLLLARTAAVLRKQRTDDKKLGLALVHEALVLFGADTCTLYSGAEVIAQAGTLVDLPPTLREVVPFGPVFVANVGEGNRALRDPEVLKAAGIRSSILLRAKTGETRRYLAIDYRSRRNFDAADRNLLSGFREVWSSIAPDHFNVELQFKAKGQRTRTAYGSVKARDGANVKQLSICCLPADRETLELESERHRILIQATKQLRRAVGDDSAEVSIDWKHAEQQWAQSMLPKSRVRGKRQ